MSHIKLCAVCHTPLSAGCGCVMGNPERFAEAAARCAQRDHEALALDALQIQMSKAVDLAKALPAGSVDGGYESLIGVYVGQIAAAVARAT